MAWSDVTVTMLRHLINDVDAPQTYTDTRLELALLVGAQFIKNEFGVVSNYVIDFAAMTISPDPVSESDPWMINLTVLRTAIIMLMNDLKVSSLHSFMIKDVGTTVDLRESASLKKDLLDVLNKMYVDACLSYQAGNPAGVAILSPINLGRGYARGDFRWYGSRS